MFPLNYDNFISSYFAFLFCFLAVVQYGKSDVGNKISFATNSSEGSESGRIKLQEMCLGLKPEA